MKPGLFKWERFGRAWVAYVGNLPMTVNERGSLTRGRRWIVRDVFGVKCFSSEWRATLEAAILEAEAIALREALPSLRKLVAARSKLRSRK